ATKTRATWSKPSSPKRRTPLSLSLRAPLRSWPVEEGRPAHSAHQLRLWTGSALCSCYRRIPTAERTGLSGYPATCVVWLATSVGRRAARRVGLRRQRVAQALEPFGKLLGALVRGLLLWRSKRDSQ